MKEFLIRLSSRKFLLTIAGITLVTLFPDRANDILTLIVTFVGAEGVADTVSRYSKERTAQADREVTRSKAEAGLLDVDDPVDKSDFISGDPEPDPLY